MFLTLFWGDFNIIWGNIIKMCKSKSFVITWQKVSMNSNNRIKMPKTILDLPLEIHEKILSYIADSFTLHRVELVCQLWATVIKYFEEKRGLDFRQKKVILFKFNYRHFKKWHLSNIILLEERKQVALYLTIFPNEDEFNLRMSWTRRLDSSEFATLDK